MTLILKYKINYFSKKKYICVIIYPHIESDGGNDAQLDKVEPS